MLYLVGTPIGNLGDISSRAVEVLSEVDCIACEDTRVTGLLLQKLGITGKKLVSYHEHNKVTKGPQLIEMLKSGITIAQVSDAGMPAISDPGEDLVKLCIEENVDFTVIPGPVAAITALVLSGLSTRYYHMEGFLPNSGSDRKKRIDNLKNINETIIIYEAPHRIKKLMSELLSVGFSDSKVALCRELTKKYEEVLRMTVEEASKYFEDNEPRGEYVVCLEPKPEEILEASTDDVEELARHLIDEGLPTKQIASRLSEITGRPKKEMYTLVLNLLK
ncbi:MAG: 16S rRNA (cytidine(1402)-2'-O)-methyltransferase [Saccharofermentans sp.]|nr:16S rRNA (cytidine(1402)-2'-O)-methyltransferase [Saccharofermentans sp.]